MIKVLFLVLPLLLFAREAAVSGVFYPLNKQQLQNDVHTYLGGATPSEKTHNKAFIVPHAGYKYSANVASKAYINLKKNYKNIFIIASSHHYTYSGASVYTKGDYKTPLGKVALNLELAKKLVRENALFSYKEKAHNKEHSIEVQLPFLQTLYQKGLKIVPILIGTKSTKEIHTIAKILQPYFQSDENLFIISSDFSHYPNYERANYLDKQTIDTILSKRPSAFVDLLIQNDNDKKADTLACGWSSVLMLMYMTQNPKYQYELLKYANSGDVLGSSKKRVVGYGAIKVYEKPFYLSKNEKRILKEIAKNTLYEAVLNAKVLSLDSRDFPAKLKTPYGAFVTLYKNEKLRGCIGTFEPKEPLYKVIQQMSISSAFHDTRFQPVSKEELSQIRIKISVLTPRKKITSLDEIVISKHGVYLQKGSKNGTYLPHVATQMGWDAKTFVQSCAQNKAGLDKDEYKDAEVFIYESIEF